MSNPTDRRPAVITLDLVTRLIEFLAFRHLFRGASIALMRWDKLSPLVDKVEGVQEEAVRELEQFRVYLQTRKVD
jgi:hypothetical protein